MATAIMNTTTGIVYVRGFTGTLSAGTIQGANGSSGAPTFSFVNATNSGVYKGTSGVNITALGTIAAIFTATTLTTNSIVLDVNGADVQLSHGAQDRLDLASGDSFRIVSGGLGVGVTNTSAGTIASSGKISPGGLTTSGSYGVPGVVATGRSTAQTAAVGSVSTYTVGAADGTFVVSANVLVTTATSHSFTVTVAYTDEGNTARTTTLNFATVAGVISNAAITNTGGAVPYEGIPYHIRCKAATTITVATTGTFTTVTYNVEGIISQLA